VPRGRELSSAVHWETIYGGFHREIAPAGALIATDHELIVVAEEKARRWESRSEEDSKYGKIMTYFPLRCLADYQNIEQHSVDILSLEVHAKHGGEKLEVAIPKGRRQEVEALMEKIKGAETKASAYSDWGTAKRKTP